MAGVPKTLTDAQVAKVETLAAVLTSGQMADYFGISRRTFDKMMEREPKLGARYKKGKARAIGAIAQSLIARARGGGTASMIFYLKTQTGWRERDRLQVTGHNGGPVEVTSAREKIRAFPEDGAARLSAIEGQAVVGLPSVPEPAS